MFSKSHFPSTDWENIDPIEKINKIDGYSFEWNEDKQDIYKGKDYGVIAQEIEEILPELVNTRDNGYKAVNYDKLISLLIGGIKETQEMLDFCGKHNITSDIELIAMQEINTAFERITKNDVKYRFVIDMKSLK